MGIFKNIGKKKETTQPGKVEPIEPIEPNILYNHTAYTANYIQNTLLKQYESMLNAGQGLTLQQYEALLPNFVALAQSFEKIYELMRFDMEKLQEIRKYNELSYQKRMELIKQLENTPNNPDEPPLPKNQGKAPGKP